MFYIWKDEMRNVFKDAGVVIFFFLVPLAYPVLYAFIYNNEVVHEARLVVVDPSDSYLSREFTRRVDATADVRVVRVCADMAEAKRMPDGVRQREKENVYLTMLSVKNELRGGRKGYAERTARICRTEKMADLLKRYGIRPRDKANRIIAWVMRRPDRLRCACGRMAFALHDALAGRHG